jgi:UDP-N-acetylmuramyl pentapeptide synthase
VTPESVSVGADGRPTVVIDGRSFTLPLLGAHQAENSLFAWAVARSWVSISMPRRRRFPPSC